MKKNNKEEEIIFINMLEICISKDLKNFYLEKEIEELKYSLLEIKKILKKHNSSLDYEPWSTYKVSGDILFDISIILDSVGSDEECSK